MCRYQMRAGKNQQLHLMAEEIRHRIESLRKENLQQRQWLDVRTKKAIILFDLVQPL